MKHLKLFEGFFKDMLDYNNSMSIDIKETKKSVKEEMDSYMFEITDEYQSSSKDDYTHYANKNKDISYIRYENIFVEYENVKDFLKKLIKIRKILNTKYYLDVGLTWKTLEKSSIGNNGINRFIDKFESGIYLENTKFEFKVSIIDYNS